jgi:hypothetical protein
MVAEKAKADEARRREKEALEAAAVSTVEGYTSEDDTTLHPIHSPAGDGTMAIIIDPAAGTVSFAGRRMSDADTNTDQNDEDDIATGNPSAFQTHMCGLRNHMLENIIAWKILKLS